MSVSICRHPVAFTQAYKHFVLRKSSFCRGCFELRPHRWFLKDREYDRSLKLSAETDHCRAGREPIETEDWRFAYSKPNSGLAIGSFILACGWTLLASTAVAAAVPSEVVSGEATGIEFPNPFSSGSLDEEPSDPFTLQGSTEKKFVIEEMDGNKVLKRRRGISVRSCVKVASNSQTDSSGKIIAPVDVTCRVAEEASNVRAACQKSCQAACSDGLDAYQASAASFSGFKPKEDALMQARKKCIRNCGYQCQKEGTGYIFTVNSLS